MTRRTTLVNETITTALTAEVRNSSVGDTLNGVSGIVVQANFTYGSGGTTVDVYIQTTFDGGVTWTDIMTFAFTTASSRKILSVERASITADVVADDGALTDDTAVAGLIGDGLRAKVTTTGTYAGGTTLRVDAVLL